MSKIQTILLSVLLVFSGIYSSAAFANKPENQERFLLDLGSKTLKRKNSKYKTLYDKKLKRIRFFNDGVILKFKPKTKKSTIKKYMLKNKLKPISKLGKRIYSCKLLDSEKHPEAVIKILESKRLNKNSYNSVSEEDEALEDIDIDEYRIIDTHRKRKRSRKRSRLALQSRQWHLQNLGGTGFTRGADINVSDAWRFSKGLGVKVAVIDTGFDLKHKDINYYNVGYDVTKDKVGAYAPKPSNENHGTAVAGIIAALDNDRGVVGVAPKAQIIPIRLITDDGFVSVSQIIAAHRKAVELGADIINNSWGSFDPSLDDDETLDLTSLEEDLYRELEEESHNGRGLVVVFASGNSGASNFNNAPEARNPYTLAVGASNSKDSRASYSLYGPELDLVAPGGDNDAGIVTTDRKDLKKRGRRLIRGYNKGNFAKSFVGTSAAAPVVSGVAALVWSINPSLTAKQVKQILRLSARSDVNSKYEFSEDKKNDEIGYGIVDAGAAVRLAMQY